MPHDAFFFFFSRKAMLSIAPFVVNETMRKEELIVFWTLLSEVQGLDGPLDETGSSSAGCI